MRAYAQESRQSRKGKSGDPARAGAAGLSHETRPTLNAQRPFEDQAAQRPQQSEPGGCQAVSGAAAPGRLGHDFSRIPVHARTSVKIQPKLVVNTPGDSFEEEADRISEEIVRTPGPQPGGACPCGGGCPKCQAGQTGQEPSRLQLKRAGGGNFGNATAPGVVHEVLSAPGHPLDPSTRGFMETRFGHDLSGVRIHTDRRAAESARAVQARAFTVGRAVVFGEGEYSPHTPAGQRLLAHELVHTLQQSASEGPATVLRRQTSLDIALRSPGVAAQVLGSETLDGFDLNSPVLKAEHKRRLLALAKRVKQLLVEHRYGTVQIIGHTDATGEEALNDRLGQDRADAVAAFLRAAGVPAMALLADSAGESDLRVPTARREPRNRRVEVRFLPELPTAPPPATETAKTPEKPVRIPTPDKLCQEHPEICDPITTKPEAMPSCRPQNCSALEGDPFDRQPPDLQLVLTKSFKTQAAAWFDKLDSDDRGALTQIFNRMCQYGVWCHVRLVLGIVAGEAPLRAAGHTFKVYGSTPSVFFTSPPGNALLDALMATGKFCMAFGAGASEHPGQTTIREISGSDSLHISIGPGDMFDAHVDRYGPVPEHPGSAFCPNEPTPAAVGHIGREVLSGKVRKGGVRGTLIGGIVGGLFGGLPGAAAGGIMGGAAGEAGLQVFPDPGPQAPVPPGAVGPEPFRTPAEFSVTGVISLLLSALMESSRVTVHGPVPKRPEPLVSPEAKRPSPDVAELEAKVIAPMRRELEQKVGKDALLPSRVRVRKQRTHIASEMAGPDEEAKLRAAALEAEEEASSHADPHLLGLNLAARMEQARNRGEATVRLPLGPTYGGLDETDRKFIAGEIQRIAIIVRKHLPDRAEGVRYVIVFFGVVNNVKTEVIDLPE